MQPDVGQGAAYNGRMTPIDALKVVGNEEEGGSRRWQMIGIGLGLRRSRFVCLLILLSSLILFISVSAPVKQNEKAMS